MHPTFLPHHELCVRCMLTNSTEIYWSQWIKSAPPTTSFFTAFTQSVSTSSCQPCWHPLTSHPPTTNTWHRHRHRPTPTRQMWSLPREENSYNMETGDSRQWHSDLPVICSELSGLQNPRDIAFRDLRNWMLCTDEAERNICEWVPHWEQHCSPTWNGLYKT